VVVSEVMDTSNVWIMSHDDIPFETWCQ